MRRGMLAALLAAGMALGGLVSAGAENAPTEDLAVEQFVALVLEHSRDIEKAEQSVQDALEEMDVRTSLEGSSVSVSGGLGYVPPSGSFGAQWGAGADASLSVPILPQVSLSGRIDDALTGSVSLSLKPFALGLADPAKEESYLKALVKLTYTRAQTALEAEKSALDLLARRKDRVKAQEDLDYREDSYHVVSERYALEDATHDEYIEAGSQLSTARRSALEAEKRLLDAQKDVKLLLGPDVEAVAIGEVSLEQLLGMIDARRGTADDLSSAGKAGSQNLEELEIGLDRLEADLERTWLWRPNLSISAGASVPLESFQATVSLSFSLSDLKTEERDDLKETIADQREDISLERYSLEVEGEIQKKSVATAEYALEVALTEVDQNRLTVAESEVLHEQGYLTDLELRQSRLALRAAEISAFSSACDLYYALGELILLYQGEME